MRVSTSVARAENSFKVLVARPASIQGVLLGSLIALFSVACLDVAPPPTGTPLPSATPTETFVPTATPIQPTATSTSTSTPTMTPSPTLTATATPLPNLVIDPRTGLPTVPQFPPPTGQLTPSAGIGPGSFSGLPGALPGGSTGSSGSAGGGASEIWGCDGDESIEFVPPIPVVGQKVFIYVTAARDRQFVLLYGPQTTGVADKPISGGKGLRRVWEVAPTVPGIYTYEFYGGPSPQHRCVTASFEAVTTLARSVATPTPAAEPIAVSTPRPDH